jgi:hypothetical protein
MISGFSSATKLLTSGSAYLSGVCGFSSQNFWKRGSFRSGSNIGSRRSSAVVSDALPFGKLWYGEPNAINNAVDCAGGERFEKASKSLDKPKD